MALPMQNDKTMNYIQKVKTVWLLSVPAILAQLTMIIMPVSYTHLDVYKRQVSGSSPAYVYMMIEAMADAAVVEGMPRPQAYTFAAQAVLGSAQMVLETGKHPGELKDMVCSPGGTTIAAVAKLEESGFRSSIMQGMKACADKSREMSK